MIELDITKTNQAIDRLLERTQNPRHRYLLQSFHRHRFLEIAGRYREIFAPEMMVEHPEYHFYTGRIPLTLEGQDAVRNLYALSTHTSECIFYAEDEQLAVGDNLICSNVIAYQQHPASRGRRAGFRDRRSARDLSASVTPAHALDLRCGG